MTDADNWTPAPGDAIYARRAGNKTPAWYVVSTVCAPLTPGYVAFYGHRQYGSQRDDYMLFRTTMISRIDPGRWA